MGKSIPIPIPIIASCPQQFGRAAIVCMARARPVYGMEAESCSSKRQPLAEVVADCAKRWFQDALKEAKNGDISTQVLLGQMYNTGYGVVTDPDKGREWISKASRRRSSAWKVAHKRPGYNASDTDSDSDDTKQDAK